MTDDWVGYTLEELYEEKARDELVVFLRFLSDDTHKVIDLANEFDIDFTEAMTDFVFTKHFEKKEEAVDFVRMFDENEKYGEYYEDVAVLAVDKGKTVASNNRDVTPYILRSVFEHKKTNPEEE